jgi:hypothetical protein
MSWGDRWYDMALGACSPWQSRASFYALHKLRPKIWQNSQVYGRKIGKNARFSDVIRIELTREDRCSATPKDAVTRELATAAEVAV